MENPVFMETDSLICIIPAYLILVLGVALAASQRRITFYKSLLISIFLTPVMGMIVLLRTPGKVMITHYNTQDECADCPHREHRNPEVCEGCEFVGNLRKRLSVNRRYFI